jgi:hypothetical protein
MDKSRYSNSAKKRYILIITSTIFFLIGCQLLNGAIALIEDQETKDTLIGRVWEAIIEGRKAREPHAENVDEELLPNSAQEYAWQMGDRCINAPGSDPCPLEACVVNKDLYTVEFAPPYELFGKANPDDYYCGADYRLTNNAGTNLLVWHNILSSEDNLTAVSVVHIETDNIYDEYRFNYYDRHDGLVTFRSIPKIYVLYDNPHCDWIEYTDVKLEKFGVTLANPCDQ